MGNSAGIAADFRIRADRRGDLPSGCGKRSIGFQIEEDGNQNRENRYAQIEGSDKTW